VRIPKLSISPERWIHSPHNARYHAHIPIAALVRCAPHCSFRPRPWFLPLAGRRTNPNGASLLGVGGGAPSVVTLFCHPFIVLVGPFSFSSNVNRIKIEWRGGLWRPAVHKTWRKILPIRRLEAPSAPPPRSKQTIGTQKQNTKKKQQKKEHNNRKIQSHTPNKYLSGIHGPPWPGFRDLKSR